MKTSSPLLVALLLLGFSAFAQIKPKQEDWFAYDLTYDYWLDAPDGVEQSWRSNGHSFSFTDEVLFGEGSHFSFAYGLGFTSNNFYNNVSLQTDANTGEEYFLPLSTDSINSNKLTVQYIHVPIELRFRSSPSEKGNFFRFYVGGKVGVRVNSYSKLKTDQIDLQYNNLGALNRFFYGVYTRVGYSYVSLYAYYGLSNLFEEAYTNNGVSYNQLSGAVDAIRPLSVGISLSL